MADDTYGVADRFEEEESEEAADAGDPGCVGNPERECAARDGVDAQKKRRIYPVEQDDAHEPRRQIVSGIMLLQQTAVHSPANREGNLAV